MSVDRTSLPCNESLPPVLMSITKNAGSCYVPCCPSAFNFFKKRTLNSEQFEKRCKKLNLTPEHHIMFPVPIANVLFKPWQVRIPKRVGVELKRKTHVICASHFDKEDVVIEKSYLSITDTGKKLQFDKKPFAYLKPGSVPINFPGNPNYLAKAKKPRKPPKQRLPLPSKSVASTVSAPTAVVNEESDELLEGMETFEPTDTVTPTSSPVMFEAYTPLYTSDNIKFTEPEDIPEELYLENLPQSLSHVNNDLDVTPAQHSPLPLVNTPTTPQLSLLTKSTPVQQQESIRTVPNILTKRPKDYKTPVSSQMDIITLDPCCDIDHLEKVSTASSMPEYQNYSSKNESRSPSPVEWQPGSSPASPEVSSPPDIPQTSLPSLDTTTVSKDVPSDTTRVSFPKSVAIKYIATAKNIPQSVKNEALKIAKSMKLPPNTKLKLISVPKIIDNSVSTVLPEESDIVQNSSSTTQVSKCPVKQNNLLISNTNTPSLTSHQLKTTTTHTLQVNHFGIPLANIPAPTSRSAGPVPSHQVKAYSNNCEPIPPASMELSDLVVNEISLVNDVEKLQTFSDLVGDIEKLPSSNDLTNTNIEPSPFERFVDMCSNIKLPSSQWAFQKHPNLKFISFSYVDVNDSGNLLEKRIVFQEDMVAKVWLDSNYSKRYTGNNKRLSTKEDVLYLLHKINQLKPCTGTGYNEMPFSDDCDFYMKESMLQCPSCKKGITNIRAKIKRKLQLGKKGKTDDKSSKKQKLNDVDSGAAEGELQHIEEEESSKVVSEKYQAEETSLEELIEAAVNTELQEQQQQLLASLMYDQS